VRHLIVPVAGGALIGLLHAVPALSPLLEYRRTLLLAEPWRLLTGHFVHVNGLHAGINLVTWLVIGALFARTLGTRRHLLVVAISAPLISVGLQAFYPTIDWYRGASGMLHALFFAGATLSLIRACQTGRSLKRGLPMALLAGGWVKVWLESPDGANTPYAGWLGTTVVPQAHLMGALIGTVIALAFSLWSPRGSQRE
jgi:rhomboid family GlyGly-CTERM serine protease